MTSKRSGSFVALGLLAGVVIGAITDRMGLCIALGVVFGAALGAIKARRKSPPEA